MILIGLKCNEISLSLLCTVDRGVHRLLVGRPKGKRPLGRQDVDGRIILRWIFRKLEGVVGTGWS
jgi:hypothetical protein